MVSFLFCSVLLTTVISHPRWYNTALTSRVIDQQTVVHDVSTRSSQLHMCHTPHRILLGLQEKPKVLSIILLCRNKVALPISLALLLGAVLPVKLPVLPCKQRPQAEAQGQIEKHKGRRDP
jgi:hypothetical protein